MKKKRTFGYWFLNNSFFSIFFKQNNATQFHKMRSKTHCFIRTQNLKSKTYRGTKCNHNHILFLVFPFQPKYERNKCVAIFFNLFIRIFSTVMRHNMCPPTNGSAHTFRPFQKDAQKLSFSKSTAWLYYIFPEPKGKSNATHVCSAFVFM